MRIIGELDSGAEEGVCVSNGFTNKESSRAIEFFRTIVLTLLIATSRDDRKVCTLQKKRPIVARAVVLANKSILQ